VGFKLCLAVVKRSKVPREPVQHSAQISEKFLHIRLKWDSSVICWPLMVLYGTMVWRSLVGCGVAYYYGEAWLSKLRCGIVEGCGVA
jgi:hypothetical protein